jgi:hypothetical protein
VHSCVRAPCRRSCASTCNSCGWEDTYCSDKVAEPPALSGVGAVTTVFEACARLHEYGPRIRSSPHTTPPGPWVITFDSFVSDEEADAFLSTTTGHFNRSLAGDVVSPVRTSRQAWCQDHPCVDHPLINLVQERVANMTGIPKDNTEFFQVPPLLLHRLLVKAPVHASAASSPRPQA